MRSCAVRTSSGTALRRPILLLYPLEIYINSSLSVGRILQIYVGKTLFERINCLRVENVIKCNYSHEIRVWILRVPPYVDLITHF